LYVFWQLESSSVKNYKLLSFCVLFYSIIYVTKREPIIERGKTILFFIATMTTEGNEYCVTANRLLQNIEVAHSCDTNMQIFWDEINNYDPDEDDLSWFIVSDSGRRYDGGKFQTYLRRHFAFDQHLL